MRDGGRKKRAVPRVMDHWGACVCPGRVPAGQGGSDTGGGSRYSPAAYNDQFYEYQRGRGNWGQLLSA